MTRPEPRSPLSLGLGWASRITTIGLLFALPPLAGIAADRWLGSAPWGVLLGSALGFAAGFAELLNVVRGRPARPPSGPGA